MYRVLAISTTFLLAGCMADGEYKTDKLSGAGQVAQADFQAKSGSNVTGYVTFREMDGTVRVTATVNGLSPGKHGFHIHENGDCSAPDASSAGGHFAPHGNPHGSPEGARSRHHAGDLGNLVADGTGKASMDEQFDFLHLSGEDSIVGKAVVIHGKADDLTSQPSGAAGARVACGVIVTT